VEAQSITGTFLDLFAQLEVYESKCHTTKMPFSQHV
jgi:hypothetical protein